MEGQQNSTPTIHVVDRRHWAQDSSADATDETPRSKPTYVAELEQRLADREAEVQTIRAQHRAATTEFENAKARMRRELSKEVEAHRRTLLHDLLEIVDNLERAAQAAKDADEHGALREGVELVLRQFTAKLGEYGVRKTLSLGQKFDPVQHEAVSTVPAENPEQHDCVVGVIREGYTLGDEILRPATVAVGRQGGEG